MEKPLIQVLGDRKQDDPVGVCLAQRDGLSGDLLIALAEVRYHCALQIFKTYVVAESHIRQTVNCF